MSFIISIFRGEKSLGFTYWVCYTLPTLVVTLFIYGLLAATFSLADKPLLQNALTYTSIGLLFVIVFGCGVAVIRSAWHKRKAGFWGWIATIIVLLNMVRVPLEFAGYSSDSQNEIDRATQQQIAVMNVGLPKKIDKLTTLNRVSIEDKKLTYHYKIDENFNGKIDLKVVRGKGINGMCKTWKPLFDNGELNSVEYRYLIKGKVESFFVRGEDCF